PAFGLGTFTDLGGSNPSVLSYVRELRHDGEDGHPTDRSEEHTSELQSRENLVCRLLLEKKKHGIAKVRRTSSETHPDTAPRPSRPAPLRSRQAARAHVGAFHRHSSRVPAAAARYPLSLHDALPISPPSGSAPSPTSAGPIPPCCPTCASCATTARTVTRRTDRKSTRLNSSHVKTSYAVFCLKKKNTVSPRCGEPPAKPIPTRRPAPPVQPLSDPVRLLVPMWERFIVTLRAFPRPPRATLFPYTTLFRSPRLRARHLHRPRRVQSLRAVLRARAAPRRRGRSPDG